MKRLWPRGATLVELLVASGLLLGLTLLIVFINQTSHRVDRKTQTSSDAERGLSLAAANLRPRLESAKILSPLPGESSAQVSFLLPKKEKISSSDRFHQTLVKAYVDGSHLVQEADGVQRAVADLGPLAEVSFERKDRKVLILRLSAGETGESVKRIEMTLFLKNQP